MRIISKTNFLVLSIFYLTISGFDSCSNFKGSGEHTEHNDSNDYVSSKTCGTCHRDAYNDWLQSDHYKAIQEAADSSVLGNFNTIFHADGVKNTFFKKGNKFFINTQGEDGLNHDYEVKNTFGFFPLQQYLIEFPGGRLQAARVSWNSRDNKWFHQYPGQKVNHKDWLHWTGNSQNWNTMCAACHSTNLKKNYDFEKDTYQTTWSEMTVGCESCHGPGKHHVDFVNSEEYRNGTKQENAGLYYGKNPNNVSQLNTCAPCHARKTELSPDFLHSSELLDNLVPQVISNENYYADGQIREEDYEYGSFTQSKMFKNNVRCSNCHNPHNGKLLKAGNELCLSCHDPKYNSEKHHFHPVKTESSRCINCHMVQHTYMGNDYRRDHSFRVPRPDQSLIYHTPNACINCHSKKSNDWAARAIEKWYGAQRKYHFSDDLLPGSLINNKSEAHLIRLLSDTSQPAIARATSAYYLGNIPSRNSADALLTSLSDVSAQIRYQALRSLENINPEYGQQKIAAVLNDPVRAVRIAAANIYHRIPKEKRLPENKLAFDSADAENKRYLEYQTDFSVGNVMLGDYYLQEGDQRMAIRYYLRGLKKDSLMNYARFNLSASYNSLGKNNEALNTLLDAAAIDPLNDRTFYNLGLLYFEMDQVQLAADNFKKAEKLGSTDPGLYFNYGLLLQKQGDIKGAEKVLLKGLGIDPNAANLNFALSYLYVSQKQYLLARKYAKILKETDPLNANYQTLFSQLEIN